MELNKFITETIVKISKWISGAQEELKGANCVVNPKHMSIHNNGDKFLVNKKDSTRISIVQDIEVNVAITEMIQEGGRAGIGVVAGIFGAGSEQSSNNSNQVVSTVNSIFQ